MLGWCLAALVFSGCLENLNQERYFDLLEAADPGLARRIERNREAIEHKLRAALEAQSPAPIEHVGMWGESWDVVRRVTDGETVFMKGRIFHPEGPASTYYLAFIVDEDGSVEVTDARVFARRGVQ